jgi:hypothetical protein
MTYSETYPGRCVEPVKDPLISFHMMMLSREVLSQTNPQLKPDVPFSGQGIVQKAMLRDVVEQSTYRGPLIQNLVSFYLYRVQRLYFQSREFVSTQISHFHQATIYYVYSQRQLSQVPLHS